MHKNRAPAGAVALGTERHDRKCDASELRFPCCGCWRWRLRSPPCPDWRAIRPEPHRLDAGGAGKRRHRRRGCVFLAGILDRAHPGGESRADGAGRDRRPQRTPVARRRFDARPLGAACQPDPRAGRRLDRGSRHAAGETAVGTAGKPVPKASPMRSSANLRDGGDPGEPATRYGMTATARRIARLPDRAGGCSAATTMPTSTASRKPRFSWGPGRHRPCQRGRPVAVRGQPALCGTGRGHGDRLAIGPPVLAYAQRTPYRVITGAKLRIQVHPRGTAVSEVQLGHGDAHSAGRRAADEPVNGQHPYSAWISTCRCATRRPRLGAGLLQKNADSAPATRR